ncbi:MAG: NAD(P)/FAD-dependent oxidoreductase [Acidimicrobiia bacterium]|nr:NAD(P)/FAD-dependent oxidoreductase [Acidimicrobiia bacterium]
MSYDAIVIGGGHNGLVNAAYLAKAGRKTLVLERRHVVGGAAVTEELHPGFNFTTFSYAISLLRPDIVHDLDLVKHGMMVMPLTHHFAPMDNGDYLLLGPDDGENYHEIARHSAEDAEAYRDYGTLMDRVVHAVQPLLDEIPPNIVSTDPVELAAVARLGGHLRSLDPKVLHMLVRLLTGSAADILDEYFETEVLKGLMASSGIIGTKVGPYSQGSGLVLLYHVMGEIDGVFGEWGFHKGGNGGFTQAVARAAQALGAEIRTEASVSNVITRNGEAVGVALESGEELYADVVVSALDPRRTFLQFVDRRELPTDLVEGIESFKFQGTSAKVNFALDALPKYPALGDRTDQYQGFINIGPSMRYLERAFDDAKYGWYSSKPFIDGCIQSVLDPDMSPPGKHIMSCFVQYAPYHLEGSDWDTEKDNFGDTVQSVLEDHFPGFGDLILHREVVTPLDIERTIGLSEGNIFAGEFLTPQMFLFRPAPGWNQYRTPIKGYYQCGSGTHPGGCVMGAPGKLAARQILGDTAP